MTSIEQVLVVRGNEPQSSMIGLSRRRSVYDEELRASLVNHSNAQGQSVNDNSTAEGINAQRNGMRAWYSDYSSIDWIHDALKERVRVRTLRRISGFRGTVACALDSMQGWTLLFITGISVGAIASLIDVCESLLLSLRDGYCSKNAWNTREQCCRRAAISISKSSMVSRLNPFTHYPFPPQLPLAECTDWVPWSTAISPAFDSILFILSGVAFAFLAVAVTNFSKVERAAVTPTGKKSIKYQAAGGGISEIKTILGGFVIRGFLGIRTLVTKVVGLIFCIASGLSLGQQGPLVHISCCFGNIYSRLFLKYAKNEGKRREILSAASAAGVAVNFASPIGGVLFSLEEVSYYFPMKTMWRSFFCSLMAAMTLKVLNPYGSGKLVKFQVVYSRDWRDFELVPFALLGFIGGVYGALFIRVTNAWADVRKSKYFPFHPIVDVGLVALVTAAVNLKTPLMRLSLNEIKEVLFSECVPGDADLYGLCSAKNLEGVVWILLSLLFWKTLLVLFSFGLRVPGGMVGSSMMVGACFGRIIGILIFELQQRSPEGAQCLARNDCVTPGIYALVGGAAALCGVTRMTVSLVVVMVELTGALKLTLPLMVAIMVAKWTGDSLCLESSYNMTIIRNNYPYLDHKREFQPRQGGSGRAIVDFAGDVAEYDSDASFQVNTNYSKQEVAEKLQAMSYMDDAGFAVLDGQSLVGYISFEDVKFPTQLASNTDNITIDSICPQQSFHFKNPSATPTVGSVPLSGTDLTLWMDQAPLTVSSRASMDLVLELFMKVGCKTVCVLDGGGTVGARFCGMLTKKRVIAWIRESA